jgi:arginine/ornithine transport system permease protein
MFDLHGYFPFILQGFVLTVGVAVCSLALAVVLGMIGAVAKLSGSVIAKTIAGIYTTVIRGVPDLVLMLIIFFGGQLLVNDIGDTLGWGYIDIDPFTAGTISIGFIFGAYMTETFRGGILGGATRQPFTFYFVVALLFLVITGVSDVGLRWVNKRARVGVREA